MWSQLAIANDLLNGLSPISDSPVDKPINSTVGAKAKMKIVPRAPIEDEDTENEVLTASPNQDIFHASSSHKTYPPVCYLASAICGYKGEAAAERERELNTREAEEIYVALNKLGFAVICPQTMNRFMGGIQDYESWMLRDFAMLLKSDCVFYGIPSPGTDREIQFAAAQMIPILGNLDMARDFILKW